MPRIKKATILDIAKPKTVLHEITEWGGEVDIKVLSMAERLEIEDRFMDGLPGKEGEKKVTQKDIQMLSAMTTIYALVDEKGEPLFENVDDLYKLAGPIPKIINEIFLVATGSKEPKKSDTDS